MDAGASPAPPGGPEEFNERDAIDLALVLLYRRTRSPRRLEQLLRRFDLLLSGVVSRYSPPVDPADALVPQLALLGFLRAVERFEKSCGVPFAVFARSAVVTEVGRRRAVAARAHGQARLRALASAGREPVPTSVPDLGEIEAAFVLLGRRDPETTPLTHIAGMLSHDVLSQPGATTTQISRVVNRALVRLQDDLRDSPDLAHADDPILPTR